MEIQLIPVLEIGYDNQNVPIPTEYPYWKNAAVWDKYHQESFSKAGFKDELLPYLAGSSFYRLADITESNLIKLIKDHTEDLRNGKYGREQASALSGGYILRIDEQDKFFPQCCGDLSDIIFWEQIADGRENAYYEGHPGPVVKIKDNIIIFDLFVDEYDEPFQPAPSDAILQIEMDSLRKAVDHAKEELVKFSERLKAINESEQLNIADIDKLLVWDNPNRI